MKQIKWNKFSLVEVSMMLRTWTMMNMALPPMWTYYINTAEGDTLEPQGIKLMLFSRIK